MTDPARDPHPQPGEHDAVAHLTTLGYTPESVAAAVAHDDMGLLAPALNAVTAPLPDPGADPLAQRPETRAALSSPAYRAAFDACMSGAADALPIEQTDALRLAQRLTGTAPPGLPMPIREDESR